MPTGLPLTPHHDHRPLGVRRIYIQNLTDLLHVCLLRGEVERARRAWGILIRCREVDWRTRWYWGLELLSASKSSDQPQPRNAEGRDVERWLKSLRVSSREADKPSLLHALVLHLIKHDHYRAALDELETYLSSYPYLLSGPLHTYAGMLAFYLAQPPSAQAQRGRARRSSSSSSSSHEQREAPNPGMIRQARGWFSKALEFDKEDEVALELIRIIEEPESSVDEGSEDGFDDEEKDDQEGEVGDMEDSDKGENEEMVDDLSESEEDETDEGEDADEKDYSDEYSGG